MEKRFKPLKKITLEEASRYVSAEEDLYNNDICFYTVEPSDDPEWEIITYYTDVLKKD